MTQISIDDRDLLEKAIFLPMAITVFNHDLLIIQSSSFKLKIIYDQIIHDALKKLHKDLVLIKMEMKKRKLGFHQLKHDEYFTQFLFIYNGYKEHHNYFNPAIRNKVQQTMLLYLQSPN